MRLFFPGTFAILAPLLFGLYNAINTYEHFGPNLAIPKTLPWLFLATFGGFIFGILILYRYHISKNFVALYEAGIVIKQGSKRFYSWKQINAIQMCRKKVYFALFELRELYQCSLLLRNGTKIKISKSTENLSELIKSLKHYIYQYVLPELDKSFNEGRWLNFGSLKIQKNSFEFHRKQGSWKLVNQVSVKSGSLVIELSNQKIINIPVAYIPNLEVLLQIINLNVNTQDNSAQLNLIHSLY